jgi:hypothetical protein
MRHNSTRYTRARRAVLAVAFAVVATASAGDRVVVEDWRSYPLGTRGIPSAWKEQAWGKPAYDLEIVSDNGRPDLEAALAQFAEIAADLGTSNTQNAKP